jgi:hypothetical protein
MTVAPANTSSIIVAITGVLQDPSTYSVSGTTLTFSAAPPSGTSNISVRYLGIPASGVTTTAYRTVTDFTATAGQTSFSVPSYTVGYIDVYRNGVRLVSTDFTATTGTTVVLANACTVGDAVVTESFYVSSVLNAIPATAGSVSDSYIVSMSSSKLTGTQTIPSGTLPTGSVLQVIQATDSTSRSTSSSSWVTASNTLTVTITPKFSTSKILILSSMAVNQTASNGDGYFTIFKNGSTNLGNSTSGFFALYTNATYTNPFRGSGSVSYLDSPATTSATTYQLYMQTNGVGSAGLNNESSVSTITVMEIAA